MSIQSMLRNVDTAAPKPDELAVPDGTHVQAVDASSLEFAGLPEKLLEELWSASEAEACGLSLAEFGSVLAGVGTKHNYGMPSSTVVGSKEREAFFSGCTWASWRWRTDARGVKTQRGCDFCGCIAGD